MKIFIVVIFIVVVLSIYKVRASKVHLDTDGGLVKTSDLPLLVKTLQEEGDEGAFWVILIPGTSMSDGFDANLQFSIENSSIGLDWVLVAERNILDEDVFLKTVETYGLKVKKISNNGVDYLRVENSPNLLKIAEEILIENYGVSSAKEMPLIITGFDWK